MPNIQELEQALIAADKAGDKEAATALASDMDRLLRAQPETTEPFAVDTAISIGKQIGRESYQAGSGVLEGAMGVVNLPMDVVRTVGEVAGAPREFLPKSTAELQQNLREAGVTAPLPETLGSKAVRFTGEVLGGAATFPTKPVDVAKQAMEEGIKALKAPPGVRAAAEAGYKVPRSNLKPSAVANLGERFGGKEGIEAIARIKNQEVTNNLAAKALGLKEGTQITPQLLESIRFEAGQSYEVVKKIGTLTADKSYIQTLKNIGQEFSGASKDFPELSSESVKKLITALSKKTISSEGAVEMAKNLRRAASSNWKNDKLLSKAQRSAADALDDLIERNIAPSLGKQVLKNYQDARVLIAKSHVIENALNEGTNNVVATEIAKQAGKRKLTGELKQISDFASAFKRVAHEQQGAVPAGGLLEPLVYGTSGGLIGGPPGAAAAAIPIAGKPIVRRLMLTTPSLGESAITKNIAARGLFGTGLASK